MASPPNSDLAVGMPSCSGNSTSSASCEG
jgi:hypothetical protein